MSSFETLLLPTDVLLFALNLAGSVILVTLAALVAGALVGQRSVPIRHALLTCGLVLILSAPVLTWTVKATGVARIQVAGSDPAPSVESDLPPPPNPWIPDVSPMEYPADLQVSDGFSITIPESAPDAGVESIPTPETATMTVPGAAPSMSGASDAESVAVSWGSLMGTFLVALWALGAGLGILSLTMGLLRLLAFRLRLKDRAPASLQGAAVRAADRASLARTPSVYVSARVRSPLVLGLFRPVIVVPVDLAEQCSAQQMTDVLMHEAAHVARGDQWVSLAQRLASVLFWWCPLVHVLTTRLSNAREELCDNYVLQNGGDGLPVRGAVGYSRRECRR